MKFHYPELETVNKSLDIRSNFGAQPLLAFWVKNSSCCSSKFMRRKVQDDKLLVWIHFLRNVTE